MKKVLFLPFLQIQTGHHHVAQALTKIIQQTDRTIHCTTREILSNRFGHLEGIVSKTYLKWIHHFPDSYNWLYHKMVYNNDKDSRYLMYEILFQNKMKSIIKEEQPDLIVCTHGLPSYILSQLKAQGEISIPILNVYTDFFVHKLWGTRHIEYHFVSTIRMKEYLIKKQVDPNRIYVTGIPIHPDIKPNKSMKMIKDEINVLVAGGSLGVGFCESIINDLKDDSVNYYFLCGKNSKLFEQIKQMNQRNLIPLPYIDSKKDINDLYDHVDAVVTKPGGVTMSECLRKHKPVFVFDALPGQEQINLEELNRLGVIIYSKRWKHSRLFESDLLSSLRDEHLMQKLKFNIQNYNNHLKHNLIDSLFKIISNEKLQKVQN